MGSKLTFYTSGTLGDHLPYIELGAALKNRGHKVKFAVNSAMTQLVSDAGLEYVELNEAEMGKSAALKGAKDWNHWEGKPRHLFNRDYCIRLTDQLISLAKDADMLISTSLRPWAWFANFLTDTPLVTFAVAPYHFRDSKSDRQTLKDDSRFLDLFGDIAKYYESAEMMEAIKIENRFMSNNIVLASSPSFSEVSPQETSDRAQIHQTGFIYYQDPEWQNWKPNDQLLRMFGYNKKPVILTFSSLPLEDPKSVLNIHAEAAAIMGRPLIVQSGWSGFQKELLNENLANHPIYFTDFIPHDWVFPRVACAIQHGGIGSIARALYHGCPILIEPYGNDQFFNALRVKQLGVGRAMRPSTLKPESLARVIETKVLSEYTMEKVQKISRQLKAENGLEAACDVIEAYIHAEA